MYRLTASVPEFFLVHPGGPFWKKKDTGAWSIPKGEIIDGDDPLDTAVREFAEETGTQVTGPFSPLQHIKQKSGKFVTAWAVAGNIDPALCTSNTFEMLWPPGSGKMCQFPEVDRWEWFSADEALQKINPAQAPFITELIQIIA